ncbi:MAG TPA: acetyl-CoA carboxylase biotin carboxyl carrier protein [Thermoanaerobaculia bacterium]
MTFDQIKELVELVSQRGLSGLELERSGFRLKIDGQAAPNAAQPAAAGAGAAAPAALPVPAAGGPPALPAALAAAPAAAPAPADHILNSPIVGTFYRAPAPGADLFVQLGSRVERGQVLCIIEAMKLMNEIESDADGVIEQIFPQNAQAVEFGEPLFAIRTS